MAFLDKLLSGSYPNLEKMWASSFSEMVDRVFATDFDLEDESEKPAPESKVSPDTAHQGEINRLTALLEEAKARLEATRRQLDVVKSERDEWQSKGSPMASRDEVAARR